MKWEESVMGSRDFSPLQPLDTLAAHMRWEKKLMSKAKTKKLQTKLHIFYLNFNKHFCISYLG